MTGRRPTVPNWLRARSLRHRLLIGATLLATIAVLASQVIGVVVLRSWLLSRVDEQLEDFRPPRPEVMRGPAPGEPDGDDRRLPSDFRVYFYGPDGELRKSLGSGPESGPELSGSAGGPASGFEEPTTVPAGSGGGSWRVLRQDVPGEGSALVALPLDTLQGAVSKLLWLNSALLLATVVGLVAVGRWVVHLGLLPLTRMERTAGAIAEGNLELRLRETDPHTEIGRLGRVLNSMIERLRAALRERESSEARLRRFVADAGHELRTPLTSMRGFAELVLKHESLPAEQRHEAHRMIEQNAERMSLLVEDLLLLAKLDQEPVYDREEVDLLSVSADAISGSAHRDSSSRVRLNPLRPDAVELESVRVVGDSHRLRQVVGNLVSNALAHTPPEADIGVRVGTAPASRADGGLDGPGRWSSGPELTAGAPTAIVEVTDSGPGLTPEQAGQVFDRFYRADAARSREHGGSGLGLAIAAAIAGNHGGRIELDTRPGRGATFRLVLPGAY
ncbi:two-component system, OmpR family, sensor kinase [Actinopolyspora xinjiangensis]|uniref:histidine kinase n=1 Tax=Actinopolyspora xinjiangensis TaxID=405564 RepID=A0A1H0NXX7_9ACTN|nr:HAMP domain-containing sensor histidine kinase [Actinopolyspora xinjiangensis]SDO97408.1 two-component system, OmpR family, sensor kinase [Actinopolyspora xinjiangensis]